jgi:phosphoribosylanthranilate isomerase
VRVQVKICGLTNLEDTLCAARAGADMLGFIFTPKSMRCVPPERAAAIVKAFDMEFDASEIERPDLVGVFVDEDPLVMRQILEYVGLDYAQLHGSESVETLEQFHGRAFKAIRPRPHESEHTVADALKLASLGASGGPQLLVDAYSQDVYGGTGQLADWRYAATLAHQVHRLVLAGGLTPDNVRAAIDFVRPWAVDVSSGVETGPGTKDHNSIRRLISAVRVGTGQAS